MPVVEVPIRLIRMKLAVEIIMDYPTVMVMWVSAGHGKYVYMQMKITIIYRLVDIFDQSQLSKLKLMERYFIALTLIIL